jgi:hypothetical protein
MSRRVGRPVKKAVEGERVALTLRVTAAAKTKLEAAAVDSGRSLSQEAEMRLMRSFDHDELRHALNKDMQKTVHDAMKTFSAKQTAALKTFSRMSPQDFDALDDVLEAFSREPEPMIPPAPRKQTPRTKPRAR